MNKVFCFTVFLIVVINLGFKNEDPKYYGLIKASILNGRSQPNTNSSIKKSFSFGTPVELIKRSDKQETINGIHEYWYLEKGSNSWLFGGYLIIIDGTKVEDKKIGLLNSESYNCNLQIDGVVLDKDLKVTQSFPGYILFKGYYIYAALINLYPQNSDDDLYSVVIGKYEKIKSKYIFTDKNVAIYNKLGEFKRVEAINDIRQITFKLNSDEKGEYYTYDFEKLPRNIAKNKCKNTKESFSYSYYEYRETPYKEIVKKFPMIIIKK